MASLHSELQNDTARFKITVCLPAGSASPLWEPGGHTWWERKVKSKDHQVILLPDFAIGISHFRGYVMTGLNGLPYGPTYGSGGSGLGYSRYWDFGQFGNIPGLYNTPSYPWVSTLSDYKTWLKVQMLPGLTAQGSAIKYNNHFQITRLVYRPSAVIRAPG